MQFPRDIKPYQSDSSDDEWAFVAPYLSLLPEAASGAGVVAWIFGHHHWSQRLEVHGVELLAAQPGYPGEETGWTGPGVLTL